jgi:hypothetical protein
VDRFTYKAIGLCKLHVTLPRFTLFVGFGLIH